MLGKSLAPILTQKICEDDSEGYFSPCDVVCKVKGSFSTTCGGLKFIVRRRFYCRHSVIIVCFSW